MPARPNRGGLVYSTDSGRMCPDCRRPVAGCACGAARTPASASGVVRVALETKGRNGKAVTVIRGVPLGEPALADFGKALRTACGCGGTIREGVVELQGDHVARAVAAVQARGWAVKLGGG